MCILSEHAHNLGTGFIRQSLGIDAKQPNRETKNLSGDIHLGIATSSGTSLERKQLFLTHTHIYIFTSIYIYIYTW